MQNGLQKLFFVFSFLCVTLASAKLSYYDDDLPHLVASPAAFQTRDIYFFPEKGSFLSKSEFSFEYHKSSLSDAAKTSEKAQRIVLIEDLSFSTSDNLLLGFEFGFLSANAASYLNSIKNDSYSLSGMRDPSFYVQYRAIDQKSAPYFLDLKVLLSPSFGQSLNNNALRGGYKFEGVLSCGQVLWDYEYKFNFYASFYPSAKVQNHDGVGFSTQNPSYDLGILSLLQYDFDRQTSMDFVFDVSIPQKSTSKTNSAYKKPFYLIVTEFGPSYQFEEFLSASLRLTSSIERGDFFQDSELSKQVTTHYGLKANLNYSF